MKSELIYDMKIVFPPIGEDVLCYLHYEKKWYVDCAKELSHSDGGGVCFWANYKHNYSHWCHLPKHFDDCEINNFLNKTVKGE